jgi:transcriptional regulatory protein RtcR
LRAISREINIYPMRAAQRPTVVIGFLGVVRDFPSRERWSAWRPTVSLCQHEDLLVERLELLHQPQHEEQARRVLKDIELVSPETEARHHALSFEDPWDFQQVFGALHEFARTYPFDPDREDYLVHITTGTHVAQICLFLLTESRHFPARLLQTSPPKRRDSEAVGSYAVIDLDLSRYDQLASRFAIERTEGLSLLKSGIETRNGEFNRQIERIERIALGSKAPILLMGPTGSGKSQLARRVEALKRGRRQLEGPFVEVNCATLRGDSAMSTLFGHRKGAFTGAVNDRTGLLRGAHRGLLFLDEIGELGLDEQTMLLRALEEKRFMPLGSDVEVESDFELIAGTNRDLERDVAEGRFRDDLLARINLWTFRLPGLRDRIEDIEPNLEYELEQFTIRGGRRVRFNREAQRRYLRFATSGEALWNGNFRDLSASVTRMATLSRGDRITVDVVEEELERLRSSWRHAGGGADEQPDDEGLEALLGSSLGELDRFDRVQLLDVVRVCRRANSLSEAGRVLFAKSRSRKRSSNDADRLRKYLGRFGLEFRALKELT